MRSQRGEMDPLSRYTFTIFAIILLFSLATYIGLFNVRNFMPIKCSMEDPFICIEASAYYVTGDEDYFEILMVNKLPYSIEISLDPPDTNKIYIKEIDKELSVKSISVNGELTESIDVIVPNNAKLSVRFHSSDSEIFKKFKSDKITVDAEIKYTDPRTQFTHIVRGKILSQVQ